MHQFLRSLIFLAPIFWKGLTVNFKKNFGIPILLECNKKVKLSLQVYVTSHLFSSNSHVKFTGKNKVDNTLWAKSCAMIGQKQQNSFQ